MTSPTPALLSCPEMVALLTTYLEGGLDDGEHARFDAHLELCPGCVTYVDQFRETIRATGTLAAPEVPPDVMADLVHAFRDWRSARPDL